MSARPLDEFDRRIVDSVRQHWTDEQKPLLLSELGGRGDIGVRAKNEEGSLANYLRVRLTDSVAIIRHSIKSSIVAAVPAGAADGRDFDSLLEKPVGHPPDTRQPRFVPALWAAFRRPLEAGKERYVSVKRPIRFVDVVAGEHPENRIAIRRECISDAPGVIERINQWIEENELDRAPFLFEERAGERLPSNDVLGRFLLALDSGDMERISIPLDIVNKLRREPL